MKLTATDLNSIFNISMYNTGVVNSESLAIKMLKAVDELDYTMVAEFYNNIGYGKHFVIEHPSINGLETYPVHSYLSGMTNFIIFTCKEFKVENIWILCQVVSTVSAVIYHGKLYYIGSKGEASICQKFLNNYKDFLLENDVDLALPRKNCLLMANNRPYHFIYDSLYPYFYLGLHKENNLDIAEIYTDEPFFALDNTNRYKPEDNKVFLKINGINRNSLVSSERKKGINHWEDKSTLEFEEWLYNKYKPKAKKNKNGMNIWIGIIGQKRAWHQQIIGYANIIKTLTKNFDQLTIYIDGWTSPEGLTQENQDDLLVYNEIKNLLVEYDVNLVCLIGADYEAKIKVCDNIDYHISAAGSGSFIPERICHIPGIVHGNNTLNTFNFDLSNNSVFVTDKAIVETPAYINKKIERHGMYISYHVCWQYIYNKLVEVISKKSEIELEKITVPSLHALSTNYALNQLYTPSNKRMLEEVFSRINSLEEKTHLADTFKEMALACERLGDYATAKHIMRIAKALRPHGALISKKDDFYSSIKC